jgi:hypothetical protein
LKGKAVGASNKPLNERGSFLFEKTISPYMPDMGVFLSMHAYDTSKYGHHKQVRDDGRRYFDHPRAVAYILLLEFGYTDQEIIQAALLHDIMEDSFLLKERAIEHTFGSRVAMLVKLMTKTKDFKGESYWVRLFTFSRYRDQIPLKFADRIHNLRTLFSCSRAKQLKQIKETRESMMPWFSSVTSEDKRLIPMLGEITRLCNHYDNSSAPPPLLPGQILWVPGEERGDTNPSGAQQAIANLNTVHDRTPPKLPI